MMIRTLLTAFILLMIYIPAYSQNNKIIVHCIDVEYIGIIRALFSEKELLVIFYNAFYTDKGQGMRDQLKNTNFFGEEKDLPLDSQDDLQHFINKNLIFEGATYS